MADVVEDVIGDVGEAFDDIGSQLGDAVDNPLIAGAFGGAVAGPAGAATGVAVSGASQIIRAQRQARNALEEMSQASTRNANALRMQFEAQRRQADIQNTRNVRGAIRQARAARASIVNAGANTGTLGSSGVQGGASSVMSQLGGNMSFFDRMGKLNEEIISAQVEQARAAEAQGVAQARLGIAQQRGAMGQTFLNLGMTIFSGAGGFKSIFGTGVPRTS